jgi:hypothetical protein
MEPNFKSHHALNEKVSIKRMVKFNRKKEGNQTGKAYQSCLESKCFPEHIC